MKTVDPMRAGWQLAALSTDVRNNPLPRTIAGTPVVLFRSAGRICASSIAVPTATIRSR